LGEAGGGRKEVSLVKHMTPTELLVLLVAIMLMLGGAALMLAEVVSATIAIPMIAVGIALSIVAQRRRQHIPSH
jgi:hypothetical protein